MNVFAYGTLADQERQRVLCGKTFPMKEAVLQDYRLDEEPGFYRMIYPEHGSTIEGVIVMGLDEKDLKAFDEWENEGELYRRVTALASCEREMMEVWAYEGMGRREKIL